jgi:hypothetical protein
VRFITAIICSCFFLQDPSIFVGQVADENNCLIFVGPDSRRNMFTNFRRPSEPMKILPLFLSATWADENMNIFSSAFLAELFSSATDEKAPSFVYFIPSA